MALGDRFSQWVEERTAAWKDRLAGWTVDVAAKGVERMLDDMEPALLEQAKEQLTALSSLPGLPPATKRLLDSMAKPKSFVFAVPLLMFLFSVLSGLVSMMFKGVLEPARQQAEKISPFHIPDLGVILDMRLRQKMEQPEYEDLVSRTGWSKEWADRFLELKHPTLPSDLALSAWMRDHAKYQPYVDHLTRLGLTPDDIALLTELQWRVPGVQDIIRYVVREAYDEATYKKFGQDQEYPAIAEADAAKAGVRPDQLKKEWIAHWELPGITQGFEMLHRGAIDAETLQILLKARDVMPYWRDKLTAISYIPYNRIDARRMWDLRVIGDEELTKSFLDGGYDQDHANKMALWSKIYVSLPGLIARYKNGWISPTDVFRELTRLGLDEERAYELWQAKIQNEAGPRTATQKDLTVAQIIKGVKMAKITRAQASVLLTDMGYDLQEATFILAIEIPEDDTDAAVARRTLTRADILAGLKSGVVTRAQAVQKLVAMRYTALDAEFIVKVYEASIRAPTPEKVKKATRADIENSVKLGLITTAQAYQMLLGLKYTAAAAEFIRAIVVAEDTAARAQRRLELARADIIGGLKSGVLLEGQALTKLAALGYTDADAAYIVNVYQASITVPTPAPPKEVSKADIIAAVKRGLVTPEEGFQLLIQIGYSDEAATFILSLVPESSPFSPVDFHEFQQLTRSWRNTQGAAPELEPPQAVELKVQAAQAVLEGRAPMQEQLRIQIDTIRRQRRKGLIDRAKEVAELTALKVPPDYVKAVVGNDDTRLEKPAR